MLSSVDLMKPMAKIGLGSQSKNSVRMKLTDIRVLGRQNIEDIGDVGGEARTLWGSLQVTVAEMNE
jgi:hypothetical protein